MKVTLVDIHVLPDHLDEFIAATRLNVEASRLEPGNRRFDLLQDPADAAHLLLYEAYRDEAAAQAHRVSPHFARWLETVSSWFAGERTRTPYVGLIEDVAPEGPGSD